MTTHAATETQAERAAETRSRILEAALAEFAANGLAGARTENIAQTAGVNKALLYYYFESKEKLYTAALELASTRVRDSNMEVFLRDASAGERVLRLALTHFDRIRMQGEFQRLMQQEMMRVHKGESGAMLFIVQKVFAPVLTMYQAMVREGIGSGELIDVNWLQIQLASLGANVLYFLNAPIWRLAINFEPFALESIRERRVALVEFLGQAIFTDRKRGAELAAKILADTPEPSPDKSIDIEGGAK